MLPQVGTPPPHNGKRYLHSRYQAHTHKGTNIPPFDTWGILTFDISIDSYKITPFSFFFSLLYATGISVGKGPLGAMSPSSSGSYCQIRWACTGGPICLATFFLFQSTGTARDHRFYWREYSAIFDGSSPTSRRRSRDRIMPIYFTRPLCHGSNRLNTATPTPRSRLPQPLGINLGTYNIRDDCCFAPPRPYGL